MFWMLWILQLWKLLNCDCMFAVPQIEERITLNLCSFCGFSHVKRT